MNAIIIYTPDGKAHRMTRAAARRFALDILDMTGGRGRIRRITKKERP